MAPSLLASTIAGAIFGCGLFLSGVYSPWIILSQMNLSNFHMLQTFLAASGCSAIALHLARKYNIAPSPPRSQSSLGILPYDGNILGGLLLGAGMTLTGACPGTVLVQVATGIRSGHFAFVGGILAGTLYAMVGEVVRGGNIKGLELKAKEEEEIGKGKGLEKDEVKTVHHYLGVGEENLVVAFESFLALILALASLTEKANHVLVPPVVGGLLIGVGQAATLVLTGNAVGVSGAYGEVGEVLRRAYSGGSNEKIGSRPKYNSIAFATGIVFRIPGGEAQVDGFTAVLGGFVMVLGARTAGGCTSGHGISGMATFSISSIISVAAMFAGGMGLALFV
ncbi:YeeE/YedE family protein [Rhexocercosporidium sp. MPI-PUGE-AT-0058]|nr:YeeE/YedE family protein [Rhexocercosporidium sp. MPI-PUGE-AT-0058]